MNMNRSGSAAVPCEPALVYEILSDYGNYAQWLPGLKTSQLLAHESNFAIAELEFHAQPGQKMAIECIHAPNQMVVARTLEGNEPHLKIEWNISPADGGRSQVKVKVETPLNLAFLTSKFRSALDPGRMLAALTGVAAGYGEGPAGDKVIEIVETEDGLICWYRGTKYQMKATS